VRAIAARAYRSSITREAVTARELMACAGADAAGTGEHGSGTAKAELDLGATGSFLVMNLMAKKN
jgi:hypothetical protein